jgi:V/A-type H+-transporting ATPase subunit D
MTGGATRWRLLELQRRRAAIDAGVALLDRKREALLRALTERQRIVSASRRELTITLASARDALDRAAVDIGPVSCRAAAAAQPPAPPMTVARDAVVGVRIPRIIGKVRPFVPGYGPGGTSFRLDEAGRAYTRLLPVLMRVAEQEHAVECLRRAVRRTARTLNALRAILLPAVDADIRAVRSGLEEEEREEAVRWRARTSRTR